MTDPLNAPVVLVLSVTVAVTVDVSAPVSSAFQPLGMEMLPLAPPAESPAEEAAATGDTLTVEPSL